MFASRPSDEVRGRQVLVRRYTLDDAAQLHEAISAGVEHLLPWMPWAKLEPLQLSAREQLIGEWIDQWDRGEDFNYGIFRDDQLVGSCGLHQRVGPRGLEIGYWTRATALRQGIATDAAACLVSAALSIHSIDFVEIHHDAANVASGRVPQRLGFALIDERPDTVEAPAEIGSERVWRLDRTDRNAPLHQ